MADLKLTYYQNTIASLHCKVEKGVLNPAKPLLVLSILGTMDKTLTMNNRFEYTGDCESLFKNNCYKYLCKSSYYYPFYYLENDGFWHLHWKRGSIPACKSAKYIRDNVEYASLDDSLWTLWTNSQTRNIFKQLIIETYLSNYKNTQ